MNRISAGLLILSITMIACNQQAPVNKKDPLESARGFIESSLQGDYGGAKQYLLTDSTNTQYFEGFKEFYNKQNETEKEGYRNADIIIDSMQKVSDSVTIVYYANTFKKKQSKLKMVKQGNDWLVDFKYTFQNNQ